MNHRRGLLRLALIATTASILIISGSVWAQDNDMSNHNSDAPTVPDNTVTPISVSQYKIGVVDLDLVFNGYQRQVQEYAALRKERDDRQTELDKLSEKVEAAKQRYKDDKDNMTEEERFDLQEQISSDLSRYQTEFKRLQGDIDRMEKRLLESLFKEIKEAIALVGSRDNYHLVFESGAKRNTGLLYSSPTLNMTQKVIDQLNNEYVKKNKSD